MKVNEGKVDRAVRVIAGLALVGMALGGVIGAWGYLGIVPLLSGVVGLCPLYSVLGINTCPLGSR
jgi:hypothetical protein